MKSGFGGGLKRNRVLAEIAANSTTETRVLQLISANAQSLTADQTASLNNVSLGDITDFTGTLNNYWQFGVPDTQASGSYAVTTYSAASTGLTLTTSHADTRFNGSGLAKPVGFWRMLYSPNFDIAIDVDNISGISSFGLDEWDITIAVCIGSSFRHDSMIGARLHSVGGTWKAERVVKPTYDEQWSGGSIDSITTGLTGFDAASPPTSVRLRVQHSNSDTGYKCFYSLDGGTSYTTLEGSNGGTGFYQMHAKDSGVGGIHNRYGMGGPHLVLVSAGQSHSQTSSAKQGVCRVTFKDLS
jgi:hypothetical protein